MLVIQTILSALLLTAVPAPQEATLLFVTTPGCVPCRQFAPLVREIAEMGYSVETVDASTHPELVRDQLQVRQFPTFLMLSHDKIVDRVVPTGSPINMKPRILKMFELRTTNNALSRSHPVGPAASPAAATAKTGAMASPALQEDRQASSTAAGSPRSLSPPQAALQPFTQHSGGSEIVSSFLASSVKLRVDADNTHSWGTGTIIDTRQGEALILTCGHVFRDSKGEGNVEVHLFGENSSVRVFGRCLFYDLEIDLALVVISPPCPVRAVPIAPPQYRISPGQQVLSVGCDGGANPTLRSHRVMSTDRIGTPRENAVPFHYIQVSESPVSGRSGGGLFSEDGFLIGVCNTADPVENDGHFVPPQMIRHVLHKMQLSAIGENPSLSDQAAVLPASGSGPSGRLKPLAVATRDNSIDRRERGDFIPMEARSGDLRGEDGLADEIQLATLEEIRRRAQDGDEVIVIIKSRRNPEIPSDIVFLSDPSDMAKPASSRDDSVIFSSHDTMAPDHRSGPMPIAGSRTVSFPVPH